MKAGFPCEGESAFSILCEVMAAANCDNGKETCELGKEIAILAKKPVNLAKKIKIWQIN